MWFDVSKFINKIKRATRLSRKRFSNLFNIATLQLNNFCIQSSKHVNKDFICNFIINLHINSIISKIRRWRIELCDDMWNDVIWMRRRRRTFFYFVESDVRKTSTYNIFCITLSNWFIFAALKSAWLTLQFELF